MQRASAQNSSSGAWKKIGVRKTDSAVPHEEKTPNYKLFDPKNSDILADSQGSKNKKKLPTLIGTPPSQEKPTVSSFVPALKPSPAASGSKANNRQITITDNDTSSQNSLNWKDIQIKTDRPNGAKNTDRKKNDRNYQAKCITEAAATEFTSNQTNASPMHQNIQQCFCSQIGTPKNPICSINVSFDSETSLRRTMGQMKGPRKIEPVVQKLAKLKSMHKQFQLQAESKLMRCRLAMEEAIEEVKEKMDRMKSEIQVQKQEQDLSSTIEPQFRGSGRNWNVHSGTVQIAIPNHMLPGVAGDVVQQKIKSIRDIPCQSASDRLLRRLGSIRRNLDEMGMDILEYESLCSEYDQQQAEQRE